LVLVRPDGHVAWRGPNLAEDVGRLIDLVRGAAGAPSDPSPLGDSYSYQVEKGKVS
jgi:hypothetical protein